ncbi:hypothetical protein SGRI78S_00600 [Streptomyces griseus subsp. griseus]
MTHPFLDLPPLTADRFAAIERRVARLLATEQDVVITQGEALLPLEGCIRGGARPGSTALNVVRGTGYCRGWPAFDRAQGARLTDEDGHSYLDFFAGPARSTTATTTRC